MNLIPDYSSASSTAHWLHVDIRGGAKVFRERMKTVWWTDPDRAAWIAILDRLIEKLTAALAEAKEARAALDEGRAKDVA